MPPCPDCNFAVPDIRSCGFIDFDNKSTLEGVEPTEHTLLYGNVFCDASGGECTSDDDCIGSVMGYVKQCLRECGPHP